VLPVLQGPRVLLPEWLGDRLLGKSALNLRTMLLAILRNPRGSLTVRAMRVFAADVPPMMHPVRRCLIASPPPSPCADAEHKSWRTLVLPSHFGITNSRSLAILGAMLANGGVYRGVRVLQENTLALGEALLDRQPDHVLGTDRLRFSAAGWSPDLVLAHHGPMHGWAGFGGSLLLWDRSRRISFHHVMNALGANVTGDLRARTLLDAAMRCVAKTQEA
jgi:CubicO group peptidase (beta-lactamase class C family)